MAVVFPKTDAEVKKQVWDELRWDCRTDGGILQVDVQDGVVTLSGVARNYAIKHAAEEATRRIAGVQSVCNQIAVKIPYLDWKADIEIAEAAAHAFEWDVLIPHEQVTAVVQDGFVTLIGEVSCWSQREEVERAVSHLMGVHGVTNNIRVNVTEAEPATVCQAIEATLARHSPQEAEQVHVEMTDGAVHLSGEVPTWEERCAVVRAAGFAPGVQEVVDELRVAAHA